MSKVRDIVENERTLQGIQLNADKLITVGTDGDFTTINEALTEASKSYPLYKQGGYSVEIRLLSNFVMQEQVIVVGIDMGYITITGEDAETVVQRDRLTSTMPLTTRYPIFGAASNAVLPIISQLFNMDTSGDGIDRDGIIVYYNSSAVVRNGAGVKNAAEYGLICHSALSVEASGSVFSYGTFGVYANNNSSINLSSADVSNTADFGVRAVRNSSINADYCTVVQSGSYSIDARWGSRISALYSNCSTDGDPTSEYIVDNGSTIDISAAVGETDTNISVNTLTSSGIIYS